MNKIEGGKLLVLRTLALTGVIAAIFYISHVIGGRMVWRDYNPLIQPISDLTAVSAISQPMATKILWGYNIFNSKHHALCHNSRYCTQLHCVVHSLSPRFI